MESVVHLDLKQSDIYLNNCMNLQNTLWEFFKNCCDHLCGLFLPLVSSLHGSPPNFHLHAVKANRYLALNSNHVLHLKNKAKGKKEKKKQYWVPGF